MNRTSRKLSVTEAGQVYLERTERVLQDVDELRDAVTQLAVRPRGTLRIQSRISLGTQHLAPLIPACLAQYPDLKIDLWLTDRDLDLTEHGIDIAIRTGDLADSRLVGRRLASSPRVISANPEYWAQHGRPTRPEVIMDYNCLTYRFEFGSVAALCGLGVALLPAWPVKEYLQAGTLEQVLTDYETTVSDLDFGIYAVYLSRRNLSVKTRLFIDYLVAEFSKQDWS